ncbi:hypothetical protein [Brevibacillus reuszeri]|uniref:hypothetical protein n=1 Tax=Brevibacillus reuszeri TaxID=54915 RepID=UPI000CCC4256|nr:hypothetical protein [Brevibacillus reuszeri]
MLGFFQKIRNRDPFSVLTDLGRKLYEGNSSIHDFELWEGGFRELCLKKLKPVMQDRLMELEEMYISYLLLHFPDDSRVIVKYGANRESAASSVRKQLAILALCDTYKLLSRVPDIPPQSEVWCRSLREYIDVDNPNQHSTRIIKDIDKLALLELMIESAFILRSTRKVILEPNWNNKCDFLLPRLLKLTSNL